MTRLFYPGAIAADQPLELAPEQARYVSKVLRLKIGDELIVFNGDDGEWRARLLAMARNSATLEPFESLDNNSEPGLHIHLVQGISRGERMDIVIQKATELGVSRITPVFTHRGMVKLEGARLEKKRAHWQGVANSACEQSGRIRPPQVDTPVALNSWFGENAGFTGLSLFLNPWQGTPITSIEPAGGDVQVLIGPEGGFSEREVEDAAAAGFESLTLGPRILRTETAAIAAITAVQLSWGDLA